MNPMRVAIVGATGAVGRTMLEILQERDFPLDELTLLASGGQPARLRFRTGSTRSACLLEALGRGLALASCGSAIAQTWVPQAAKPAPLWSTTRARSGWSRGPSS
jgi:aspartate-semialdehyde dehydrogenase